jgi:hypothetical protein
MRRLLLGRNEFSQNLPSDVEGTPDNFCMESHFFIILRIVVSGSWFGHVSALKRIAAIGLC